jgi:hypothetical protein
VKRRGEMKRIEYIGFSILALSFFFAEMGFSTTLKKGCEHNKKAFHCIKFIKNYDGDTFTATIPGIHPLLGKKIRIRVHGIDSAEIKGRTRCEKKKATKAKKVAFEILSKAKRIDLLNIKRGKYFRIAADVMVDGKTSLAEVLVKSKLAYPYSGKRRPKINWCTF